MALTSRHAELATDDELAGLLEFIGGAPAFGSPLEASAIIALSRMIRVVGRLRARQVSMSVSLGLHVGDLDILYLLQRAHRRRELRVTDISGMLRVTPGGISKRIDRLEAGGLVVRVAATGDRRACIVKPTESGIALAEDARKRTDTAAFDALDEEQWQELDALLQQVSKRLAQIDG